MYQDQDQGNQPPEKNEQEKPYTFTDEDTRKKIQRHISDPNDQITENDIKNVKIPGSEDPVPEPEETSDESTSDNKSKIKKVDKASEGKPTTPWDIVD